MTSANAAPEMRQDGLPDHFVRTGAGPAVPPSAWQISADTA